MKNDDRFLRHSGLPVKFLGRRGAFFRTGGVPLDDNVELGNRRCYLIRPGAFFPARVRDLLHVIHRLHDVVHDLRQDDTGLFRHGYGFRRHD